MSDQAQTILESFAGSVDSVLETEGEGVEAIWRLGPLLQELSTDETSVAVLEAMLKKPERPRFVVSLGGFDAGHATPVHSHQGWGIFCLLAGSDRYTSWRRVDGGGSAGTAELALIHDHHVLPGEFAYWFGAPYNVHRQIVGPDGARELILHARSGRRVEHFDLDAGTVEPAPQMR